MNRYRIFFVPTSTQPPSMPQKLTKHGRCCMQINQIPIISLVEIVEKSSIYQHILQEIIVKNSKPDHYTIVDSQYNNFYFYELVQRIVVFDFCVWCCVSCKLCQIVVVVTKQCATPGILHSSKMEKQVGDGHLLNMHCLWTYSTPIILEFFIVCISWFLTIKYYRMLKLMKWLGFHLDVLGDNYLQAIALWMSL